ncbi:hypothetical protein [Acidocella sp.]|uniref:hypothetical protein n=1 Tax=Acidocella sp. TaxID=50710 RepID=UPI00262EB848|nr:hypothetical protein [Acidocella sp.]
MTIAPRFSRPALTLAAGLAGLALLAACSGKPKPQTAMAPAAAVGHVYPVAVDVPPPVSPRIHFTASQQAADQQAFNVIGLKSALMVAALTCQQQPEYDQFMGKFQPHVLAEQRVMDSYFRKASGRYSGQAMEDQFVTGLANDQTISGQAQGALFCVNSEAEFKAVLALTSNAALDQFVTASPPDAVVASTAAP